MQTQSIVILQVDSRIKINISFVNPRDPDKLTELGFIKNYSSYNKTFSTEAVCGDIGQVRRKITDLLLKMDYLDEKLRKIIIHRLDNENAWRPVPYFHCIYREGLKDEYSDLIPGRYGYKSNNEFNFFLRESKKV